MAGQWDVLGVSLLCLSTLVLDRPIQALAGSSDDCNEDDFFWDVFGDGFEMQNFTKNTTEYNEIVAVLQNPPQLINITKAGMQRVRRQGERADVIASLFAKRPHVAFRHMYGYRYFPLF